MKSIAGLIRKSVTTLIVPLSLVISIFLSLSATAQFFDPVQAEFMPLFGLFFPVFFLLSLLSLIALIILANRFAFIPLLLLITFSPQAIYYIGRNQVGAGSGSKLITMNLHGFRGYGNSGNMLQNASSIARLIKSSNLDYVCLQEFRSWSGNIVSDIKTFTNLTGLNHFSYSIYWPKGGIASDIHLIISRYPINKSGPIAAQTGRNLGHFADIDAPDGAFRLVSVHLVSFSLDKSEIDMLGQGEMLDRENVRKYFPRLSGKLTNTFRIRAMETKDLLSFTNKSALPLVLAGDFNDTPASFMHRNLRRAGFTDTHPLTGKGIGATYAGRLPLLRIDYVFLSPAFEAGTSNVVRTQLSDHYPLIVTFGKRYTPDKKSLK